MQNAPTQSASDVPRFGNVYRAVAGIAAAAIVSSTLFAAGPAEADDLLASNGTEPQSAGGDMSVATTELRFEDVTAEHRFADAVTWLVTQRITQGRTASRFDPDGPVSRGQMAAFLWRVHSSPAPLRAAQFTDIAPDAWNAEAVSYLAQKGITQGVSATRYGGAEPVTRAQMATFLWRMSGSPRASEPAGFGDVPAPSSHARAIDWLAASGITTGVSASRFNPSGSVTRGQMAAFLWRMSGQPGPSEPGANRLGNDVVVLDPASLSEATADETTGEATFTTSRPDMIEAGRVVFIPTSAAFPDAAFGRVVSIGPNGRVHLAGIGLDEIVPQADVNAAVVSEAAITTSQFLGIDGGDVLSCGLSGNRVRHEDVELSIGTVTNPGHFKAKWGWGDNLDMLIDLRIPVELRGTLHIEAAAGLSCTADLAAKLRRVPFGTLPIGPVPVVITGGLTTPISLGFEDGVDLTVDMRTDVVLGFRATHNSLRPTAEMPMTPRLVGQEKVSTGSVSFGIGASVEGKVAHIVGVGVSGVGSLSRHLSMACPQPAPAHGYIWRETRVDVTPYVTAGMAPATVSYEPRTFTPVSTGPLADGFPNRNHPSCDGPVPVPEPEPTPLPPAGTAVADLCELAPLIEQRHGPVVSTYRDPEAPQFNLDSRHTCGFNLPGGEWLFVSRHPTTWDDDHQPWGNLGDASWAYFAQRPEDRDVFDLFVDVQLNGETMFLRVPQSLYDFQSLSDQVSLRALAEDLLSRTLPFG